MRGASGFKNLFDQTREYLREQTAAPAAAGEDRKARFRSMAAACAVVFLIAVGVRLLHWQDVKGDIDLGDTPLVTLIRSYEREAERMRAQSRMLFPSSPPVNQDSRMIIHPPGYSLLVYAMGEGDKAGRSHDRLRWFQIIMDSVSAVVIVLLAAHFFRLAIAALSGLLVAFSPHLAYYSLWLSPESLAVLPIVIAVLLVALNAKRPRLSIVIAAGVLVGLSCWLRSNAMLLAFFLAAAVFFTTERRKRALHSLALAGAMVITISPITLRNYIAYDRFIPLSLGAGITMVEGIADFDDEDRFGMPVSDEEVPSKDAQWHGRADYAENIWTPDGVERDRERFRRGLEVIGREPLWFAGVMLRRAASMVRYNDSLPAGYRYFSSRAPLISPEPPFGHAIGEQESAGAVWSASPSLMIEQGERIAPLARVAISEEAGILEIEGDDSVYGDQFVCAPIAVEKNCDYLLTVEYVARQGKTATKVTSPDRGVSLSSFLISKREPSPGKMKARRAGPDNEQENIRIARMPFSSGDRREVRLVVSNNGTPGPALALGPAQLIALGPTPHVWTRPLRVLARGVERNLYTTGRMVPLILIGIILLSLAGRRTALIALLSAPVYYLLLQPAFHTEYRYIIAIHYFLFIMAAVALWVMGSIISRAARRAFDKIVRGVSRGRAS
jgi:hypothetical protein